MDDLPDSSKTTPDGVDASAKAGADKRRYKRLDVNWISRVRAKATPTSLDYLSETRIINVSLGGVFIETSVPLSRGTFVELDFTIPGQNVTVHAEGVVRWSSALRTKESPPGMGIEFVRVSTENKSAIMKFADEKVALDTVQELTRDILHQELLKLYARIVNGSMDTYELERELKAPANRVWTAVHNFEKHGLIAVETRVVRFCPPKNRFLLPAIQDWIKKNA